MKITIDGIEKTIQGAPNRRGDYWGCFHIMEEVQGRLAPVACHTVPFHWLTDRTMPGVYTGGHWYRHA